MTTEIKPYKPYTRPLNERKYIVKNLDGRDYTITHGLPRVEYVKPRKSFSKTLSNLLFKLAMKLSK